MPTTPYISRAVQSSRNIGHNVSNETRLAALERYQRYGVRQVPGARRCPLCGSKNHIVRVADSVCLSCAMKEDA